MKQFFGDPAHLRRGRPHPPANTADADGAPIDKPRGIWPAADVGTPAQWLPYARRVWAPFPTQDLLATIDASAFRDFAPVTDPLEHVGSDPALAAYARHAWPTLADLRAGEAHALAVLRHQRADGGIGRALPLETPPTSRHEPARAVTCWFPWGGRWWRIAVRPDGVGWLLGACNDRPSDGNVRLRPLTGWKPRLQPYPGLLVADLDQCLLHPRAAAEVRGSLTHDEALLLAGLRVHRIWREGDLLFACRTGWRGAHAVVVLNGRHMQVLVAEPGNDELRTMAPSTREGDH